MRLTREVVQLNIHSSTDSWTLLTPTSEGKNLEIRLIANAFLKQVLFSQSRYTVFSSINQP